jgi:apolipoprotein N-acyltransferase
VTATRPARGDRLGRRSPAARRPADACRRRGRPVRGGAWWLAVAAGALLWPVLARAPAAAAPLLAAVALLPVPALGYEGLRVYDPAAWGPSRCSSPAPTALSAGSPPRSDEGRPAAPLAWRPLPWALAWFGLDLLLTHARDGPLPFPVTPGYALAGSPYAALAAIAGPAGLGLAWSVLGCAAAGLAPAAAASGAARLPVPALALVGGRAADGGALGLQAHVDGLPSGAPRTVGVVQLPGASARPPEGATGPEPRRPDRLAAYAARAAPLAADLHVWPEAALGGALLGGPSRWRGSRASWAPPSSRAPSAARADGTWRNAVALADDRGAEFVADKRWLVPAYEGWLTPGVGERWPLRAAGWRIGVLVCWESLFYDAAADRVRAGADLLAILAHDGWAAGTATPWWHARAARLVAYAVGRPVVFAAHDGPSMVWGHDGRLLAEAAAGPAALAVAVAAPRAWRTPYVALGGGGLAAGCGWRRWRRRRWGRGAPAPRAGRQGCGASGPQAA